MIVFVVMQEKIYEIHGYFVVFCVQLGVIYLPINNN